MTSASAPLWCARVQMTVSKDGASAPTISSAFLSLEIPTTRIQSSAPWIARRLASDCLTPSGVWPTSITVSGSCWMVSRRPGQRVSRRPDRTAASHPAASAPGRTRRSQSRNRATAMAALLNWNVPCRLDFQRAEIVGSKPEIEMLPRCRGGFAADPDFVANKARCDLAMAIIFDQMRPQASAILAIDDGAAGGAGVALVGGDQVRGNGRAVRHARNRPR